MAIKEKPSYTGILNQDMVKGYKAICKKHGDVTSASFFFDYKVINSETGEEEAYKSIYCLPCLNDYLMSLQKKGELPTVSLAQIVEDNSEEASLEKDDNNEKTEEEKEN